MEGMGAKGRGEEGKGRGEGGGSCVSPLSQIPGSAPDTLSHFDAIPERDVRQTDRRTDTQNAISISRVDVSIAVLTRNKNDFSANLRLGDSLSEIRSRRVK